MIGDKACMLNCSIVQSLLENERIDHMTRISL